MKNDNFYTIFNWMIQELKLSGTELLIYAIIYGFSQDGQSSFFGSLDYLADSSGVSTRQVIRALCNLTEKGLLIKNKTPNVRSASYRAVFPQKEPQKEPPKKELPQKEQKKVVKKKYGSGNVLLTDDESEKLKKEVSDFDGLINFFSERKAMHGYKYKSDYLAMKHWGIRAFCEQNPPKNIYNEKGAYDDF